MIQVIVMNMDGALLTSDNKIFFRAKELLPRAQKQGIRLVLASGRSYCKLMECAEELYMDAYGGYLLEVNGLILYDLASGKRHIRKRMGRSEMEELFIHFRQWDVEVMAQFDDGLLDYNPESVLKEKAGYRKKRKLNDDYPWTGGTFALLADSRKGYPEVHYINTWEEIGRSINKVSVIYHEDAMAEVSAQTKRDLQDRHRLGLTTPKWLELIPLGITKGSDLTTLAEMLDIPMHDVMASGDGENDTEMPQAAGIGIAMGNAMPEVKAVVDKANSSNNENGIAEALQRYFTVWASSCMFLAECAILWIVGGTRL